MYIFVTNWIEFHDQTFTSDCVSIAYCIAKSRKAQLIWNTLHMPLVLGKLNTWRQWHVLRCIDTASSTFDLGYEIKLVPRENKILASFGILMAQLRTHLKPLGTIVLWWSEVFESAVNFSPMMPRSASLSKSCAPDGCTFSLPAVFLISYDVHFFGANLVTLFYEFSDAFWR